MTQLLSAVILFRHGARGPGDSELSAWEESDDIVTQWQVNEAENLTSRGIAQIISLGRWFGRKYIGNRKHSIAQPATFFRGSISDRAVESGRDFVQAFNEAAGAELSSEVPTPYVEHADYYFRPWKVHPESGKIIKDKMLLQEWFDKVEENKEFLERLCVMTRLKPDLHHNLSKALLHITHLAGIAECELYWPSEIGLRNKFSSCVSSREDWEKMMELSCYVWQERYLRTGMEQTLGGFLFLDMIQSVFSPDRNLSFYSGHDYTILVLLAASGLLTSLSEAMEFGAYVIFELWDSMPGPSVTEVAQSRRGSNVSAVAPATPSRPSSAIAKSIEVALTPTQQPAEVILENRVLRVILNIKPFNHDGTPSHSMQGEDCLVCDNRAVVLADLTMPQVADLVDSVVKALEPTGLPAHWQRPIFF